jgi:multiple antibiotic resistance protein
VSDTAWQSRVETVIVSVAVFDYLGHVYFVKTVLLAVAALFPIVDPLGAAPIYLAMTDGLSPEQRRPLAKAVAVNSFFLLVASTLVGAYVLDFFGLSIPAVQVAGGMVVCAVAWSLLNRPDSPDAPSRATELPRAANEVSKRAFYPLTMPLTVGPGSMSVALTLGANPEPGLRSMVITATAHTVGILIVAVSVYLCYRHADRIVKQLGPTGTSVVVRLSAFILLCIGVQIIWNGVRALLVGVFPGAAP